MKTIASQRHLFDIPEDIAYFNCAGNSPLLNESVKKLIEGSVSKSHPWERTATNYFEDADSIRIMASETLGGDSEGYAIIPAASYGISTAARAIEPQLQANDSILVIEGEFPSNVLTWVRLAREKRMKIKTVPTPENGNWTQAIINQIDENTKVLALSSCHWTNGAFIDLAKIRKNCPDKILIIDVTQTLGAMPFDFDKIKPDFLVAAAYKWLLGPYGFGLLYVSEKWRNSRPMEESWLARENAADFASLVNYNENYMPGSRRFDVGEKCTPTLLPGAIVALKQIKMWRINLIAESLGNLNQKIVESLTGLGFQIPDEALRCPHMFGAQIPEHFKGNLVSELSQRKIYVSQRGNSIRFAPHLHISDLDLNRLFETLEHIITKSK